MDILSDVNVVGELTANKLTTNGLTTKTSQASIVNANSLFSDNLNISKSSIFGSCGTVNFYGETVFNKGARFSGCYDYFFECTNVIKTKKQSLSGKSYFYDSLGETISMTIPPSCQTFIVVGKGISTVGDISESFGEDDFIYPSITAWCGGNKVDMDISLCSRFQRTGETEFSELIIGSVTPSNSGRTMKFVVSFV